MQQKPQESPSGTGQQITGLAIILFILIMVGGIIYKNEASNSGKVSPEPTVKSAPEKITAEKAYTVIDQTAKVKPPTDEEVKNFGEEAENKTVVMETDKGVVKLKLFSKDAPFAAASFMKLVKNNFYNGLIFHRVIDGFMIQGGDPLGSGSGGPGYKFIDELNPDSPSYKEGYKKGTLAMANSGPDTNGSQFFIMTGDNVDLDYKYTIFGKVVSGQDVADAISKVPTNKENDMPLTPVKIKRVYLE